MTLERSTCVGSCWRSRLAVVTALSLSAQESFSTGQNIAPAYEGWEKNADGSFNLVFGYFNRNWEEQIEAPIGPANTIDPGGPDRGQPTHFQPRRNRFVFRIRVPADFGTKELVWTLTTNGKTETAYATLKPDYFIDDDVIMANNGAAGMGGAEPALKGNKPPVLIDRGADDANGQGRGSRDADRGGHRRPDSEAAIDASAQPGDRQPFYRRQRHGAAAVLVRLSGRRETSSSTLSRRRCGRTRETTRTLRGPTGGERHRSRLTGSGWCAPPFATPARTCCAARRTTAGSPRPAT